MNTLKLWIIRQFLPKLARWVVTALGAKFALDNPDLLGLLTALATWAIVSVWSLVAKTRPGDSTIQFAAQGIAAAVSNALPMLAVWVASHGYTGDINDVVGLLTWAGGFLLSLASRPDKAATPASGSGAHLLVLLAPLLLLSCAGTGRATEGPASGWIVQLCVPIPIPNLARITHLGGSSADAAPAPLPAARGSR